MLWYCSVSDNWCCLYQIHQYEGCYVWFVQYSALKEVFGPIPKQTALVKLKVKKKQIYISFEYISCKHEVKILLFVVGRVTDSSS